MIQPSVAFGFRHFVWLVFALSLVGFLLAGMNNGPGMLPLAILLGSSMISLAILKAPGR